MFMYEKYHFLLETRNLKWLIFSYILYYTAVNNFKFLLLQLCLVCLLFYWVVFTNHPKIKPRQPPPKVVKFKFTNKENWENEANYFKSENNQCDWTISNSTKLSGTIENIIHLIIENFISSWYDKVSSSKLFTNDIENELKHIIQIFKIRLQNVDFAKLIISKYLPIVQSHFQSYCQTDIDMNNDFDISSFDLHKGVTVEASSSVEPDYNEKQYLRSKTNSILPFILSNNEKFNDVAKLLVNEILSCTILCNIFNFISEPDFFNLSIVKVIGANLNSRNQVKQLRQTLIDHTNVKTSQQDSTNDYDISLHDIINNEINLQLFKQFLQSNQRQELLDFYFDIEQIKDPLEENGRLLLKYSTDLDTQLLVSKYKDSKVLLLPNESLFRQDLFSKQKEIYKELENYDLILFKQSDFYNKIVTNKTFNVIDAVENAFTQIMNKPSTSASAATTIEVDSRSKFDDDQHLNKLINSKLQTIDRNSKLFEFDESEDEEELEDSDSNSNNLSESIHNSMTEPDSIQLAAPGNLNLAEEIPRFTQEVEILNQQLSILEPLIKKAELTNNKSQIKVLKKSKIGLLKEINNKELQKQQYIVQENDNSLYGKSKVCIQSYINNQDVKNNKQFILYVIEVQKFSSEEPNVIKAGWVVARRFNQFYKLDKYLRKKYPTLLYNIRFPKKQISMLKFQQRQIVEMRKTQLEQYLKELIQIQQICSDKSFRSFLSSEDFSFRKDQHRNEIEKNYESSKPKYLELFSNKWHNGNADKDKSSDQVLDNLKDMELELNQFETSTSVVVSEPFVKPICDLLVTIFKLNNSNSWLRGRALVVILQQLLGTTIEKKVYESIQLLMHEDNLNDILDNLQNGLFPNGKFRESPPIRNSFEQQQTKDEAKILLNMFMIETCSKIFGYNNSIYGTNKFFNMIQNEYLNKHLLFQLFDELILAIFPELNETTTN